MGRKENNQFKSFQRYELHSEINVPALDCSDTLYHIQCRKAFIG